MFLPFMNRIQLFFFFYTIYCRESNYRSVTAKSFENRKRKKSFASKISWRSVFFILFFHVNCFLLIFSLPEVQRSKPISKKSNILWCFALNLVFSIVSRIYELQLIFLFCYITLCNESDNVSFIVPQYQKYQKFKKIRYALLSFQYKIKPIFSTLLVFDLLIKYGARTSQTSSQNLKKLGTTALQARALGCHQFKL